MRVDASVPRGRQLDIVRNTGVTLAERSNGTTWAVQKTPNPAHDQGNSLANSLNGVSCVTATACIAVGDFYRGQADVPLIEPYS